MTTGKEREAAERVAEFARIASRGTPDQAPAYRDAAHMAVYHGTPHSRLTDAAAVALAYLAEHPADDAEPVTAGWLEAAGFERYKDEPHDRRWKLTVCVQEHGFGEQPTDHWLDIHEPCEDAAGRKWWPINFWQKSRRDGTPDGVALLSWVEETTRGHVRRLLAALGVDPA